MASYANDSEDLVKELTSREFLTVVQDHVANLNDIEEAIQCFKNGLYSKSLVTIIENDFENNLNKIYDGVASDNIVIHKFMVVICTLTQELQSLKLEAENKFYTPFLIYCKSQKEYSDGEVQMMIGNMLPLMNELNGFLKRVQIIIEHCIQQLAILYGSQTQEMNTKGLHIITLYEHLSALLESIITLDEIIIKNSALNEHWGLYRRMFKSINVAPGRFNVTTQEITIIEQLNYELEENLLQGMLFSNCIERNFSTNGHVDIPIEQNTAFLENMSFCIKQLFAHLESKIGAASEQSVRRQLLGVHGLYVLYFVVSKKADKRFLKQLWDMYKKAPVVWVAGNIVIYPNEFLRRHFPEVEKLVDRRSLNLDTVALAYLQQESNTIPSETESFQKQVSSWMLKLDSVIVLRKNQETKISTLLQGIAIASNISRILKTITSLHVTLGQPMRALIAGNLLTLMELLKAIEESYFRKNITIALNSLELSNSLANSVLEVIKTCKQKLTSDVKYADKYVDALGALHIMERNVQGACSRNDVIICDVALCILSPIARSLSNSMDLLFPRIRKLQVFSNINNRIREACDCSFLYWHQLLIPAYFSNVYKKPVLAQNLPFIFSCVNDVQSLCDGAFNTSNDLNLPTAKSLQDDFQKVVLQAFKSNILEKLCHDIETDLRLQIHSHLQLDDRNPFRVPFRDNAHFLNVPPLKFFDKTINIKEYVTHYLNTTFYNLTTVALHDWNTYAEMRNLAERIYHLRLHDPLLPSQTLEQGLDVLEIMRKIHVFVSKYNYNLNNQVFVETWSQNKHLNTISISHIANSIRTHGLGILNTTVNFTYQFLRKQFFIFSQFLFDDHIKSRLLKDVRNFKERKQAKQNLYSFELAEKFNRNIRKLGLSAEKGSYLDQFRVLLTHIGNAMGYIRALRSGCIHHLSDAVKFVPDLKDIPDFKSLCEAEGLSPEVLDAAGNLDKVLESLLQNFSEGTEYFNMLVEVFMNDFRSEKNMHLRNFYIILPPLTLNYVEHMIISKEKMTKRNSEGQLFTDDGFAMGVAYILKLLDQYSLFDSLQWFQHVSGHYSKLQKNLNQNKSKLTKEEQQTNILTSKRYDMYKREFELLYYSLSSARIFFRKAGSSSSQNDNDNNTNNSSNETDNNNNNDNDNDNGDDDNNNKE